jgi:TPR repeat protein
MSAAAELTPAMRLLTNSKRTSGRLLRHAEAGDAEAAFRLAVLLLCGDRPLEATEWLRRAGRAGHADALELLHHPRQQAMAARHAYRIGRDYETAGNLPAALAFLEQAADAAS